MVSQRQSDAKIMEDVSRALSAGCTCTDAGSLNTGVAPRPQQDSPLVELADLWPVSHVPVTCDHRAGSTVIMLMMLPFFPSLKAS